MNYYQVGTAADMAELALEVLKLYIYIYIYIYTYTYICIYIYIIHNYIQRLHQGLEERPDLAFTLCFYLFVSLIMRSCVYVLVYFIGVSYLFVIADCLCHFWRSARDLRRERRRPEVRQAARERREVEHHLGDSKDTV